MEFWIWGLAPLNNRCPTHKNRFTADARTPALRRLYFQLYRNLSAPSNFRSRHAEQSPFRMN